MGGVTKGGGIVWQGIFWKPNRKASKLTKQMLSDKTLEGEIQKLYTYVESVDERFWLQKCSFHKVCQESSTLNGP